MTLRSHNPSFLLFLLASGSLHVGLMFSFGSANKLSASASFAATEVQLYEKITSRARLGVTQIVQKVSKPAVTGDGISSASTTNTAVVATGASTPQAFVDEYTRDLLLLIQKRNVYPRMAQKMGHTGQVIVRLRVTKDGRIVESKILEKSAYSTLNEAAEKLIGGLPQLKPFPEDIRETEWIFNIPIDYKI